MAIKVYVNDNGTPTLVEMTAESAEALAKLVSAAQAQDFTNAEKAQARENIGAFATTGGTLTGTVSTSVRDALVKTSDDGELRICGARGYNYGAHIKLFGKDAPTDAGAFSIGANDGTNLRYLVGRPDGSLTFKGENIVRSINGKAADSTGKVIDNQFEAKATNPINSTDNDTVANWGSLGGGVYWYNTKYITDQPSQYGFLINYVIDATEVFQVYKVHANGALYYRGGNASGWAHSWMRLSAPNTYITETYSSGTSWYREWSDGFIEQGGRLTDYLAETTKTITLPKAMTTTNYTVIASKRIPSTSHVHGHQNLAAGVQTTTGFTVSVQASYQTGGNTQVEWRVSGY